MAIGNRTEAKKTKSLVTLIDETADMLIRCKDFEEESAFVLVAAEATTSERAVQAAYKKVQREPTAEVSENMYKAALEVYFMIAHEIERRSIMSEEQIKQRRAKAPEKVVPKEIPKYDPAKGHVGAFAVRALADRLIEDDKRYNDIGDIDNEAADRDYCERGRIAEAYNEGKDCPAQTYEGLARLLLEHDGSLDEIKEVMIRFLKYPKSWSPNDNYLQGQLLECPFAGVGVITKKLPHQKIEVTLIDGSTRQFLEAMPSAETPYEEQIQKIIDSIKKPK